MVNNAINMNKTNNHLSHKTTEHKKTRRLTMESCSWFGKGTKMWRG